MSVAFPRAAMRSTIWHMLDPDSRQHDNMFAETTSVMGLRAASSAAKMGMIEYLPAALVARDASGDKALGVNMSDQAHIEISGDDAHAMITGGGTLDLTNSQEFHDGLKRASHDADKVTVDLRDAFFIDTQIVQDLARAAVTLMKRGKRLHVVVLDKAHPLRVLRVSGLDEVMDIEIRPKDT